jgi:membrane-associated phospholipid phosphatase
MKKIIILVFLIICQTTQAQNADVELLDALNSPRTSRFGDPFFKYASSSSYPISLAAPATVFAVGLLKKDKRLRWKSYQMVAGFGLSMSMSLLLKYSIDRTRPTETYPFIYQKAKDHSPSFPSGNTTAAFETATSLSLNFPKWYVIIPAYAWAGSIAYGRMHLGMHYPSDVAVGMLLGTGSAWLTWKINERIVRKKEERIKEERSKE